MGEKEKVQKAKNYLISNQSQLRFKSFRSLSIMMDVSVSHGVLQMLLKRSNRLQKGCS